MKNYARGRWVSVLPHATMAAVAGALVLVAPAAPAQQQQQQRVEEVIVTGTFIRRQDSFDTASPVDVIDAADIEERGTPNIGEIIRNTTFNYGVGTVTNILHATPATGNAPTANLRGLGAESTLTLMDGRRSTSQNLAAMYPQIAIQRLETLTDGGAALYGTDAVGGVLNLIPRRHYQGMEVRLSHNDDTAGDWGGESTWSIIGGAESGNTSVVGSFEFRERRQLRFMDRPELALGAPSYSTTANPGRWSVPRRDAVGNIIGAAVTRDPGCGFNNPPELRKDVVGGIPQGRINPFTGQCMMEFGANFNYIAPNEVYIGAFFLDHAFTNDLSFSAEAVFVRQLTEDRGSPQNPGGRVAELPTVPGENPGNPFRAMAADGRPLFAEPVRDPQGNLVPDQWGRLQPARDANGNVILANNRFAHMDADAGGGIPFNEDVRAVSADWRPLGYPQIPPARSNRDGSGIGDGEFRSIKGRWSGQLDYNIPDTSWSGWLSYTYDRVTVENPVRQESLAAMSAGLTGNLVIPDRQFGGSSVGWYNPFSTQNFTCVNRVCTPAVPGAGQVQADPLAANDPAVLDQIFLGDLSQDVTTFNIIDLVFTGEIFELPGGPVGAAFGGQWRNIDFEDRPTFTSRAQDSFIGVGARAWSAQRDVYAAFGEVNVPLFDNAEWGMMDVNAAVRAEWVDDDALEDLDSTNYKLSTRWEPREWLALRGSWSTAFNTPTLVQLFAPFTVGLSNVSDAFTGTAAFIGRGLSGTPALEPQTADIYNIGFTLNLLQGDLTLAFDYKIFDFADRIVRPIPEDVLREDFANYVAAGLPVTPDNRATPEGLLAWMGDPRRNPGVHRDETGSLVLVETPLINAASLEWRGFDTRMGYRFDGNRLPFVNADIGRFRVILETTYADSYAYRRDAASPTIEGAGRRNNATAFVPPTPRWRGNLRVGWDMGIHAMTVTGRYTHGILNDGEPFAGLGSPVAAPLRAVAQVTNRHPSHLPSHTEWDIQYQLHLDGLWGDRRTSLQLGLHNMFDKRPPAIMTLGGTETFLYDPRRRVWFVRFGQEI
jgi:iron complex outermembrane recepter protein